MRVPICRCVLTETFAARLKTHPEGGLLASYLEGPPLDGQPRPVVGSDLEPVSAASCTDERKKSSCVPSFVEILTIYGLEPKVPAEE
jgi:hypothetical protein